MTAELVWMLIRQDAGGNRYRVGRYATKAEAERVAQSLGDTGGQETYVIERAAPRAAQT